MMINKLPKKLKPIFADDSNPDNCTLDRLEERSRFLIEIGRILKEKYDNKIINLLDLSNNLLINDGSGLYETLEQFEAYSDPLRKKSTILIKFLIDANLLKIKDPENFVPAMDYHMKKVLLRMGCVEVDDDLRRKLINKEELESDKEIRNACVEAIKIISEFSRYEVIGMNDFFWPLGRSCCKEKTLCKDGECNKNPCTFNLIVDLDSHDRCLFERICKGSADENYQKLWQPIVETHYY